MKKMIMNLLMITAMLSLTGCASMWGDDVEVVRKTNDHPALVTSSFQEEMTSSDTDKLTQLISIAKPDQVETWNNQDKRRIYEFSSLKIYVNERGQPCRIYRLRTASVWHEYRMEGNACRISDGSWQGSSKDIEKAG